jgi:anti-sigma B factor antagonist
MTVDTSVENGVHLFKVAGDVDLRSSPQLRAKLQEALKSRPQGILIDMAACPYIDSSGIATLVECLQGLRQSSGKMAIACVAQRVRDIFEIAHLDDIFPMFESVELARASLQ